MKGSCDPVLDKLDPDAIKKLEHLNMLERKGFEVGNLRDKLLDKSKNTELHEI